MSNPKVKVRMHGHHNSEFRDVIFRFTDKGDKKANYAHALKTAIKKEAEWTGWFQEDCGELHGLEKKINEHIDKLFAGNFVEGFTVVYGYEYPEGDIDSMVLTQHVGLVIWYEKDRHSTDGVNVGFGMGHNQKKVVSDSDTDKYENRWVSIE